MLMLDPLNWKEGWPLIGTGKPERNKTQKPII